MAAMLERIIPGFFGIFTLAISVGLFVVASDVSKDARLLAEEGVETEAEILRKYTRHTASSDYAEARRGEGGSTQFYITYRFQTHDGRLLEAEDWVSRDQYQGVAEGDLRPVYYSRSNPEISTLFKDSFDSSARIGWIAGWLLAAIGACVLVLVFAGSKIRRWMRRLRHR